MLRIICVLLLGLASSALTAETLYRWVDDRGNAQFGQNPPANRPFTEVNLRASQPPGGQLRARETAPAVEPAGASAPEQPTATRPLSSAERQARCTQAREDAKTLENNPRLARTLPSGERERIDEEERQALIRQAQTGIEQYCD